MIRNRFYRVLSVAFILALLPVVILSKPVSAAPILSTSPDSGGIGTKVSVTIENFVSYIGDDIYLFFDDYEITGSPITVPQSGSFNFDFSISPRAEPGQHQISAKDASGSTLASSLFTVLNNVIFLNGNAGVVGSTLIIRGQGFYANRIISFYYDGRLQGSEAADDIGEFSFSFSIPNGSAGKHKFEAKNIEGQSIEAEFTVLPSIELDPTSETAGGILSVSGFGFSAGSNIDVYFRNDEVAYSKTDESGSFDKALFNVPEMGPGTYEVAAVDKAGNRGSTTFTINAETIAETKDEVPTEDVTDEAGLPWYIYTLIGIGVLVIGIFIFWLRRRNTYN